MSSEYDIPISAQFLDSKTVYTMDEAVDLASKKLGLPVMGGPSGKGASYHALIERCPYLFYRSYEAPTERRAFESDPQGALQIGGCFHTLLALYYGFNLGYSEILSKDKGLVAAQFVHRPTKAKGYHPVELPEDGADRLVAELRAMSQRAGENVKVPPMQFVLEAQRLFDAHTDFYGKGNEDLTPLAVEWFARHPTLDYTCRYDMVVKAGSNDPLVKPGSVGIVEHKSAKYISELTQEIWWMEPEILGQILLWQPSGCEEMFGKLDWLMIDITTKEKVPGFHRVVIDPESVKSLASYRQDVRYHYAELATWRATGVYPRRRTNCWQYGRACTLWNECKNGAL